MLLQGSLLLCESISSSRGAKSEEKGCVCLSECCLLALRVLNRKHSPREGWSWLTQSEPHSQITGWAAFLTFGLTFCSICPLLCLWGKYEHSAYWTCLSQISMGKLCHFYLKAQFTHKLCNNLHMQDLRSLHTEYEIFVCVFLYLSS